MQLFVIGGMALLLAGCSMHDIESPFMLTTNANSKPQIWQCSLVKMATPAEYAYSDGKTYTASQLREFRLSADEPTANQK